MYATKLMMNQGKIYNYVEDDSLVYKSEDKSFKGKTITIPNVKNGTNAFTFCGTLPPGVTSGSFIYRIIYYRIAIGTTSTGYINLKDMQLSKNLVNTGVLNPDYEQQYVAATLYFPTPKTQTMGISTEGSTMNVVTTGNYAGDLTDVQFTLHKSNDNPIDLILVYNRVLTPEELEQNYKAFLQRHR